MIVSNTSPIINLACIDRLDLLPALFCGCRRGMTPTPCGSAEGKSAYRSTNQPDKKPRVCEGGARIHYFIPYGVERAVVSPAAM